MRQGLVAPAAFVFLCHVAQGRVGEGLAAACGMSWNLVVILVVFSFLCDSLPK